MQGDGGLGHDAALQGQGAPPVPESGDFLSRLLRGEVDENNFYDVEDKGLELALTEIFNYYTRKYQETQDGSFEQNQENLYRLGMRGYIALVNDFHLPIDKARVIQTWKR